MNTKQASSWKWRLLASSCEVFLNNCACRALSLASSHTRPLTDTHFAVDTHSPPPPFASHSSHWLELSGVSGSQWRMSIGLIHRHRCTQTHSEALKDRSGQRWQTHSGAAPSSSAYKHTPQSPHHVDSCESARSPTQPQLCAATPAESVQFIFIIHQSTALIPVIGYTLYHLLAPPPVFLSPTGGLGVSRQLTDWIVECVCVEWQ